MTWAWGERLLMEHLFECTHLLHSALASALGLGGRAGRNHPEGFWRRWSWGAQTHAADVEVLFEAGQLEKIG